MDGNIHRRQNMSRTFNQLIVNIFLAERLEPPGRTPKNWYAAVMAKQKRTSGRTGKTGFTVGAAAFAQISAVEGICLSPPMKKRAAEAASKGLSAEETRRAIIRAYCSGDPFAAFSEWTTEADKKAYGAL
jgi:hypothetical protein